MSRGVYTDQLISMQSLMAVLLIISSGCNPILSRSPHSDI